MDFEQQKPITNEYRHNWERIYLQQEERKAKRKVENQCHSQNDNSAGQTRQQAAQN